MPRPQQGQALVKVCRVGVCGTDLHAFEGTQPYFTYPRILGHELAVEIVETEAVSDLRIGAKATILPYFSCGVCHMCRSDRSNACIDLKVYGVHVDGGMRDYLVLDARNLIPSEDLSLDQLALIEPLSVGRHAVRRAGVSSGDNVVVVGAGPIGIATILFASLAGARVMVLDLNRSRLEHSATYSKVTAIEGSPSTATSRIASLTNGMMASIVFDATGNLNAIQSAFPLIAHGGKFVLVGLQKENIAFSHPEFHKREAQLMSSRNATREDFTFVMDAIANRRIDPLKLVTDQIPIDDAIPAFGRLLQPGSMTIKALLEF